MQRFRVILVVLALAAMVALPLVGGAADAPAAVAGQVEGVEAAHGAGDHGGGEQHGLPTAAPQFHVGPLLVTNSMILTWVVALGIIGDETSAVDVEHSRRAADAIPGIGRIIEVAGNDPTLAFLLHDEQLGFEAQGILRTLIAARDAASTSPQ